MYTTQKGIVLREIDERNGEIKEIQPKIFFGRRQLILPRRPKLAIESDAFMNFFDPELNKGIDLPSLLQTDSRTRIVYKNGTGKMNSILVCSFFRNINKNGYFKDKSVEKPSRRITHYVYENEKIMDWLKTYKKYNEDIDINRIALHSTEKCFQYPNQKGEMVSVSPNDLNRRKNVYMYRKEAAEENFAINNKEFYAFFQKEIQYNQDIDIQRVKIYDNSVKIKYLTHSNIVKSAGFRKLFNKRREFVLPKDSIQVFESKDFSIQDFRNNIVCGDGSGIKCKCDAAHIFEISLYEYLTNRKHIEDLCPKCKKIEEIKRRSAAVTDPELIHFWQNNESLYEISAFSTDKYVFTCPLCGYEYRRGIIYMVGKNPKCPCCHDDISNIMNTKEESFKTGLYYSAKK